MKAKERAKAQISGEKWENMKWAVQDSKRQPHDEIPAVLLEILHFIVNSVRICKGRSKISK